jgi:hypothetical protein
MKKVIISFLPVFVLAYGCSFNRVSSSKELIIKELHVSIPDSLSPGEKINFTDGERSGVLYKLVFDSAKEASTYAMERRLLILRKFETLIEPYFGTVNAKKCSENLQSHLLMITEDSFHATLQLLTKGSERVIHDCLRENNTDWAHIELVVCKESFYDIRIYSPAKAKPLDYKSYFECKD